jgi:hypothetical protein
MKGEVEEKKAAHHSFEFKGELSATKKQDDAGCLTAKWMTLHKVVLV